MHVETQKQTKAAFKSSAAVANGFKRMACELERVEESDAMALLCCETVPVIQGILLASTKLQGWVNGRFVVWARDHVARWNKDSGSLVDTTNAGDSLVPFSFIICQSVMKLGGTAEEEIRAVVAISPRRYVTIVCASSMTFADLL
jgi:hypothetical protein